MIPTLQLLESIGLSWAQDLTEKCHIGDILEATPSFNNELRKTSSKAYTIEQRVRIQALKELDQTRIEVNRMLREIPQKQWKVQNLKAIRKELEVSINDLEKSLDDIAGIGSFDAFESGAEMTDRLLLASGADISLPKVTKNLAIAAKDFYADLIKDIPLQARNRISAAITSDVLAGNSVFDTMEKIGKNLKDPSIFGSLANRAETIARTETLKIHSISGQLRRKQASKIISGVRKIWRSRLLPERTRDSHAKAHRDYAKGGTPGPIKVDELFKVGNSQLLFARDPRGAPEEVINCMCLDVTIVDKSLLKKKRK